MASSSRVTFVIPAYNAHATLAEAVRSLQAQTSTDWDAIIVDDGSQDETGQIAEGLAAADSRLRVIHQANQGESAARNAGLTAATGEWLAFLDADDWLLPTFTERMIAAASVEPTADVIHCGWLRVARDGRRSEGIFAPATRDLFPELAGQNRFAVLACMVRRALVKDVGLFDVSLRTCPDWDLWQRIARTGPRYVRVDEVLACYRLQPMSAGTDGAQMLRDGLQVIARGHRADPRVRRPAPRYADGMPADAAAGPRFAFLCWTAGSAIGRGRPTDELFALLPPEPLAPSVEVAAESLFNSIPGPVGRLVDVWPVLWPDVERRLDAFLEQLETREQSPGLAAAIKACLMQKILRWAMPMFLEPFPSATGLPSITGVPSLEEQKSAREQPDVAGGRSTWGDELEAAKEWQRRARAAEVALDEKDRWIAELSTAKEWHDKQRQIWQRRAECAERSRWGWTSSEGAYPSADREGTVVAEAKGGRTIRWPKFLYRRRSVTPPDESI